MRKIGARDVAADITGAFLRARVVQQRVMWACALVALTAAGTLAAILVAGHDHKRAKPLRDGVHHIWSVSSVERR